MLEARLDDDETPLSALRDSFGGGNPAWPTIRELDYDPVHRLVLDLARCCFASLTERDVGPSAFALRSAMQVVGVDQGPALFARVMAVVQSVQDERAAPFAHLTVDCARITPDEQALMNAVAMARIASSPQLLRATMALTQTDACPSTFGTLEVLGSECGRMEDCAVFAQPGFKRGASLRPH